MGLLWSILGILSLGLLVTGLIKPSIFAKLFGAGFTRIRAALVFGGIFVIVLILGTVFAANK
ncbi:MAG: hypothetical protein JJD96_03665 [Thermoleophilia bacterium]|nr:hypothetical protein [Thermoleophilia bacterium]